LHSGQMMSPFRMTPIMRGLVNRSKTAALARIVLKTSRLNAKRGRRSEGGPRFANGTLFLVGELRSKNCESAVEKATASRNSRGGIALVAPRRQCARADRPDRLKARHQPTEQEMKLTNLFWRARRRAPYPGEVKAPPGLGNDMADRSSMADLVRLLKEAEDAQGSDGRQPA
jgi:hypothetical protein